MDPTEPSDLNPDVAWRVRVLKHFHQPDCDNLYELENLNSVLEAYRCGKLRVENGQVTVFFAGRVVMGPLSNRDLDLKYVVDKVPEWQTAYGPGRIWLEEVCMSL